jgi:hypothetical protein
MRNYRGSDYNSGYPDTELYLDNITHIFNPQLLTQLAQNPTYGINFNGNLGDFAVSRDGVEIANYFADAGIRCTSTPMAVQDPLPGGHVLLDLKYR